MTSPRILFSNGIVLPSSDTPPVATFLQTHPGAYTTTCTHSNGSCLMFWERHLQRLANSARILVNSNPQLLFGSKNNLSFLSRQTSSPSSTWEPTITSLVNNSIKKALPIALKERESGEELAITVLVSGDNEKLSGLENFDNESLCRAFDVYVHCSGYSPFDFDAQKNGARLAVVGHGRDVAEAKYSDWVRLRTPLEKLRPPSVTELLLSNDGNRILEGSITNFFVVCRKGNNEMEDKSLQSLKSTHSFEVQTAAVSDGVLPGVVRQLVIEVCLSKGIPFREVAPSWSEHEFWEEAFVTNSLRILQYAESIQAPRSWEMKKSNYWKEIAWDSKHFEEGPGMITKQIQEEVMKRVKLEGCALKW